MASCYIKDVVTFNSTGGFTMRILKTVFLLSGIMMVSLSSIAAEKKVKTPYLGIKDFKYTQEQIDNLKNDVEYKKHKYSITSSSYSMSLSKTKLKSLTKKCEKKQVTPFRMGIYLLKDKKKEYKGNAEIFIINKDEKTLVEKEKSSLKKLCPS